MGGGEGGEGGGGERTGGSARCIRIEVVIENVPTNSCTASVASIAWSPESEERLRVPVKTQLLSVVVAFPG